jgi:hypothetical protein
MHEGNEICEQQHLRIRKKKQTKKEKEKEKNRIRIRRRRNTKLFSLRSLLSTCCLDLMQPYVTSTTSMTSSITN